MSLSHRRWKGKARAVESRDEGPGGTEGIVLPLELVGSGVYDGAYTLPVKFGAKNQQFSLQIDTGSSDLWVASSSCSTSSCQLTNGRLYNPSDSRATGVDFTIPYLEGSASGPVVWDKVSLGGYSIENQAFAAANNVQEEPLAPNFSGILGLALPLNSIIASDIPPVTSNDPDGAAWASNLFSITPTENAPSARFLSLSLSRPGSDQIPALLGIGRHPSSVVTDPSLIKYSTVLGDQNGILFWKVGVRAITVYVNGVPMHVNVGRAGNGGAFPSAVLDTGVPLILTTSTVANAIYGAIGINPASDGKYYVPCTTPLNMTFTIDGRPEIPIHPLDLTAEPPDDNKADSCIGLIQAADGALGRPDSTIGDMILGVPFMRNVYTVLAYAAPDQHGNFAPVPSDDTSPIKISTNNASSIAISHINPRLGLLALTDPKRALDEFNTVRVLNQPISSSGVNSGTTSHSGNTITVGGAKISVGVVVLIGVLSFFALCAALFVGRWLMMKRRFKKSSMENGSETAFGVIDKKTAYMLARRPSGSLGPGGGALSEDELRDMKYREYMRRDRPESTMDSDRTMTAVDSATLKKKDGAHADDEFGFRRSRASGSDDAEEPWDPATAVAFGWGAEATLVGSRGPKRGMETSADVATPLVSDQDRNTPPSSPELVAFNHQYSDSDHIQSPANPHRPQKSVDIPLLSAQHHRDGSGGPATVFTNEGAASSPRSPRLPSESFHSDSRYSDRFPDELGQLEDSSQVGMAGVGTASRTSRIMGMDAPFRDNHHVPSLPFNRDSMMAMSTSGAAVGVGVGNGVSASSIPRTSINTRNR